MENILQKAAEIAAEQKKRKFNFNKLYAVACMAASAVVSICLIVWAVKANF
ncbi:MAG: hypothetical protein HHJ12_17245 [Glaciimonas sp.]|nr:hypothetical protein [Glaciimonas sp.]